MGIPEEEEYVADPKWYYLWNETFGEFLLTLFLLYFIYLILVSTTWGKTYIEPWAHWVWNKAIGPCLDFLREWITPVLSPIYQTILQYTGWDMYAWYHGVEVDAEEEDEGLYDKDHGKEET